MEPYQEITDLFKVLIHPSRLAILDILRDGEERVCHMTAMLGARQAYVSQQLMVLREADLVVDRRDGGNIYYHVTRPEVYKVLDAARTILTDKGQEQMTSAWVAGLRRARARNARRLCRLKCEFVSLFLVKYIQLLECDSDGQST